MNGAAKPGSAGDAQGGRSRDRGAAPGRALRLVPAPALDGNPVVGTKQRDREFGLSGQQTGAKRLERGAVDGGAAYLRRGGDAAQSIKQGHLRRRGSGKKDEGEEENEAHAPETSARGRK